jgi:hypothetical protein
MSERKYLPTFPELVDRLSIVMLKQIRIPENREAYQHEIRLIEHDLDLFGQNGRAIYLILLIGLANETIWQNESKARAGGSEQDKLLKFTHSINGIRARAKNELAALMGERVDLKVDSLAADLPPEFGNWNIFDDAAVP